MSIIEQIAIVTLPSWYMTLSFVVPVVWIIVWSVLHAKQICHYNFDKENFYYAMTSLSVVIFLIFMLCSNFVEISTDRYQYTARLNDSYSINELYENYEEIEYLGDKTYSFKDKE